MMKGEREQERRERERKVAKDGEIEQKRVLVRESKEK